MTMLTTVAFSSSSWAAIGAPLANHLWQSTLFVGVAGLLTLMLRTNHAQARYWLWLAASAKFLIPFSFLVSMGSHLGWSKGRAITQPGLLFVVQEISQPFASAKPSDAAAAASTALAVAARLLPTLLLVVWFCGCAAVLFFWWLRWRRMTAAIRGALPVKSGRELQALRRLERSAGIARQIELIVSESALEPGIPGIFRPIMLLPTGISDRLTDAQLEAIIRHELSHVRRHDNLAAAVHMVVEATFWFHPLVWWIGGRLVKERERACDEEVLRLGSEPQVYAESILKVCEFYLESPLFCAAGVTGSNLKERIESIMTHRAARKLDLGKKLLLAAMGVVALVGPVAIGFANPTPGQAQSQPASAAHPATKFVLGDLKIEGDVHDRDGVRDRILKAWKDRVYDDGKELVGEVVEVGVREDFKERGYFEVVARDPVSQPLGLMDGKQRILIITSITEGDQFRLGTLTIQNVAPDRALSIPAATLRDQFHLRQGDLFNVSEIRAGLDRVKRLYGAKGYADAYAVPNAAIDHAHHLIDMTLRIIEGPHTT